MMIRLSITALVAAACLGVSSTGCAIAQQAIDPTLPDAVVEYGGPDPLSIQTDEAVHGFIVELANTEDARTRGMMHRESMADDAGMLFDYPQPDFASIWMRNTLIPLDILFVRENGVIAKIVTNAQPMSLRPMNSDFPVLAVLELKGGRTLELDIQPGDVVLHPLFGTGDVEESAQGVQSDDAPRAEDG